MQADISFTVFVSSDCSQSVMSDFTIDPVSTSINADPLSISLPVVTDSQSSDLGNQDGVSFCGERAFEILNAQDYETFLTYDSSTKSITIDS